MHKIESYENVLEKISQISQKMLPAFGTLSADIILCQQNLNPWSTNFQSLKVQSVLIKIIFDANAYVGFNVQISSLMIQTANRPHVVFKDQFCVWFVYFKFPSLLILRLQYFPHSHGLLHQISTIGSEVKLTTITLNAATIFL